MTVDIDCETYWKKIMANENQLNPRELGNIFENIFDASKENKVEALIVPYNKN